MTVKPMVALAGEDGNAFSILGRCSRAAKSAGWSKKRIDAFIKDAQSGDYDNLLRVVLVNFEHDTDEEN